MKTGKVVTGTVHDCNKKALERALKDYDSQLYLKWNPEKNKGVGIWELRRRPNTKTAVPMWELGNSIVFDLQYAEVDIVNHVLDLPALSFSVIDKLREMDTWKIKDWVSDLEHREDEARNEGYRKNKEELRYKIKQFKRAFSDLREEIRSGRNPTDFLAGEW